MLKGFKDFILRGNVVDLAVAVVIGAAFTAIVTAFTGSIIQPLLNAITPPDVPALGIQLQADKPSTLINFSEVIAAAINFLIVAGIVYFVFVLPIQTIKNRRKRGEEPGPAEPTDIELLAEIRDLLKTQANSTSNGRHQA
ncbi:large-conductance mechanosensitive channel protein MscL [Pseudonocardia halophobica]|uniref:Large-conductance mechanosensitive channel n=1 Tax=Pseudonocardia halophobica TaxID=29401 RepID=A0A9W6UGA6_9PSEU|nr:large conductance mechanosensitive channel protein MscL [Pseudonocardia halophobica]GLL15879.1 large-conductance mechanosensitive channel [Pseudonocardia halophobica]